MSRKEKERNRKEGEKKKESSEKVGSGLHAMAREEKFQPCRGMIFFMPRHGHCIFLMQNDSGLHVTACFPHSTV